MNQVLISIIIPVYNKAQWLETCLESVTGQELHDIEIICVDDCSTDESPEILARFSRQDARIRILTHDMNKGALAARKTGVTAAGGEYIMFVDADDTIDPGLCFSVYDLIRTNGTDMLEFSLYRLNTEDETEKVIDPPEVRLEGDDIQTYIFSQKDLFMYLCSRIIRADLCKKAFGEIRDLWFHAGDDALLFFILSYYAESYVGVQTESKYNYYLGRGISTRQNMPLEKFTQYCGMNRVPVLLNEFLQRVNANEAAYEALHNLTVHLISNCCFYFTIVPDEDKDRAKDILFEYWKDTPEFSQGIMDRCIKFFELKNRLIRRYEKQIYRLNKDYTRELDHKDRLIAHKDAEIELVYNSTSYKLGNKILRPVQFIKKTLNKLRGKH